MDRGDHFVRKTLVGKDGEVTWRFRANVWRADGSWKPALADRDLTDALEAHTENRAPLEPAPPPDGPASERLRALGYVD